MKKRSSKIKKGKRPLVNIKNLYNDAVDPDLKSYGSRRKTPKVNRAVMKASLKIRKAVGTL